MSSGEKTEKPTPRRLKKARRDGQIGNSPELGSWLSVLAASFVLPAVARSLMSTAQTSMVQVGATIQNPDVGEALGMTRPTLLHGVTALAPLALQALGTAVASTARQGSSWFASKFVVPDANRLTPLRGRTYMLGIAGIW